VQQQPVRLAVTTMHPPLSHNIFFLHTSCQLRCCIAGWHCLLLPLRYIGGWAVPVHALPWVVDEPSSEH